MASFPWILWYIWKARNEKVFSNKDVTPLDSLQIAVKEAESWFLAQRVTEGVDNPQEKPQSITRPLPQNPCPLQWSCQTDASWIRNSEQVGLGFVLLNAGSLTLFGARGLRGADSPLHAEAEGLI